MKFGLLLSFLIHILMGWFLYQQVTRPPKIPIRSSMTLNLVQLASPSLPKPAQVKATAPAPVQPKPIQQEKSKKPQEVVKKSASPLEKLLSKVRNKREQREKSQGQVKPTATPQPLHVSTVDLLKLPTPAQVTQSSNQNRQKNGPIAIDIPAELYGRYDYYFSAIGHTLRNNWTVPQLPRIESYMTIAEITIIRDGRILNHRITRSSGNAFFDKSVKDAIIKTRFPPFADDYKGDAMTVTVRFMPEKQ